MKKVFIILLGLLAGVQALLAQGKDALPFTCIERNPVTLALAGAGSASSATAAYTAFSNASVLPFFDGKMDAGFSYQLWAPGTVRSNHIHAGVAYKPTPRIGISLGYAFQGNGSYTVVDEEGVAAGTFAPMDHLVALGVGFGLGDKVSLGVNARYALQQVSPDVRYHGFSGDLSLAWQVIEGLRLSAGVAVIGNKIASSEGEKYAQPAYATLAIDWTTVFAEDHSLELMADADYFFSNSFAAAAGVQYAWKDMLFVRGGYRFATKSCVIPSHLGLGIGAKFYGVRIDVGYITASSVLGNTVTVGVGYSF